MMRRFRLAMLCFAFTMLQLSISTAQSKAAPDAPIPMQITNAKKVFIANSGGDQMADYDPIFTGGPARAYNQFYAAIKSWGRFSIVGSPADADLLLEIRQEVLTGSSDGKGGFATPLFHLEIRDPATHALLWAFHIHFRFGVGQKESDQNFDQAVNRLIMDLRALVTPTDQS